MAPEILHGDCRDIMASLPADSFDAVCTDPPYGIEALAGYGGSTTAPTGFGSRPTAWVNQRGHNLKRCRACGRLPHGGSPCRCPEPLLMTPPDRWQALQRWHEAWAREAFGVMKPGAHLVAFMGPRTGHRLTCALEDVGFEIRDTLLWLYGTGRPKSPAMLKPCYEPILLARKPLAGTLARNLATYGTGTLAIDVARFGDEDRWPTNLALDGDAATALGDRARYFYCPKPTRAERDAGCENGNSHSTVKPLALMRWLCRLIAPSGGTILDPFMGSGSTGCAALREGFRFTGIEADAAHIATARHRMWYTTVQIGTNQTGAAMRETDSEFVSMQEAVRILGVGRMTLWRRVKEGALTVYESPSNRRVRLVKRADLDALSAPRKIEPTTKTEATR